MSEKTRQNEKVVKEGSAYQTSNHGNIYFFIYIIVFKYRPPQKNCPRGVLKGVILGGLHKSISPFIQVTDTLEHKSFALSSEF